MFHRLASVKLTAAPLLSVKVAVMGLVMGAMTSVAHSAEFSLYLNCTGKINVAGKSRAASLDLAMRDNNTTALIQRSNVVPVGERFKYTASQLSYTMLYKLPRPGTVVYQDWLHGQLLVWQPNLKRLATVRMAIDRQTGDLEGELLDFEDASLGTLAMACSPVNMDEAPAPKF